MKALALRFPCDMTWGSTIENQIITYHFLGNPNGGLAKGGLARKGPIVPKRVLSGQFLLFPRGCGVQRNWSRSAPKRPRPALKWRQFAPKRPDFPGRISPRFSLKIRGLSPVCEPPFGFSQHLFVLGNEFRYLLQETLQHKIPGEVITVM